MMAGHNNNIIIHSAVRESFPLVAGGIEGPFSPVFNRNRSSLAAHSTQTQITDPETREATREASDAASSNAPGLTAVQASVPQLALPAMPAATGDLEAVSSHALTPAGQPLATERSISRSVSSHDSSSTVQQQSDAQNESSMPRSQENESASGSMADKLPALHESFNSAASDRDDEAMPLMRPISGSREKILNREARTSLKQSPYPHGMTQETSHAGASVVPDAPPGFPARHESKLQALSSTSAGFERTADPAQHASPEQLLHSSDEQGIHILARHDSPSPSANKIPAEGSQPTQSPGNSGDRPKPHDLRADPNRAPLLDTYPSRAAKAEFDYCSVRVQPFPDRFSRDEVHDICFRFGREIGPVKAVWSGLGTRSGRPYGKPQWLLLCPICVCHAWIRSIPSPSCC